MVFAESRPFEYVFFHASIENLDGASLSIILYGCSTFFATGAAATGASLSFLSPPFFFFLPPPSPPLAAAFGASCPGAVVSFLHNWTAPTTSLNSFWLTQVVNQRTTLVNGLRKFLSQTSFMG